MPQRTDFRRSARRGRTIVAVWCWLKVANRRTVRVGFRPRRTARQYIIYCLLYAQRRLRTEPIKSDDNRRSCVRFVGTRRKCPEKAGRTDETRFLRRLRVSRPFFLGRPARESHPPDPSVSPSIIRRHYVVLSCPPNVSRGKNVLFAVICESGCAR